MPNGNEDKNWLNEFNLMHNYETRTNMAQYYLNVFVKISYVTVFASNWFFGPLIVTVVMLIQTRIHAYHLLEHYRRAIPQRCIEQTKCFLIFSPI